MLYLFVFIFLILGVLFKCDMNLVYWFSDLLEIELGLRFIFLFLIEIILILIFFLVNILYGVLVFFNYNLVFVLFVNWFVFVKINKIFLFMNIYIFLN